MKEKKHCYLIRRLMYSFRADSEEELSEAVMFCTVIVLALILIALCIPR